MDRGAWWATVHGVARVGHNLVTKPPPHAKDTYFGFLLWVTESNSNCDLPYLSCPPFPGALCSVPLGLPLISYTFHATFSLRTFFFFSFFFFLPIEVKFTSCKIQHTKSENSVALRTFPMLGNHHHFLGSKHIYSHQKESSHHLWSSCSHSTRFWATTNPFLHRWLSLSGCFTNGTTHVLPQDLAAADPSSQMFFPPPTPVLFLRRSYWGLSWGQVPPA